MPTVEIIGYAPSTYVRTVRMTCIEKGVPYELVPAPPQSAEARAVHPLGKIPGMRHGAVTLFESKAICTYIDRHFAGPDLIPQDAFGAAAVEQWISLFNTAIDRVMIREYLIGCLATRADIAAMQARIAPVLPRLAEMFALLDKALSERLYVAVDTLSLADLFVFPAVYYLRAMPESAALLREAPNLLAWYGRIAERRSARETEPPPLGEHG